MADRYFRVDVLFLHKRTCQKLLEEFGHAGPLVWIALVAAAKTNGNPGHFTYASEASAWEKLGLETRPPNFTFSDFLALTGKLKQTSRRPLGRLTDVKLTHYERWQNDAHRADEAERKSRYRAGFRRDTERTDSGRDTGQAADAMRLEVRDRKDLDLPRFKNLSAGAREAVANPDDNEAVKPNPFYGPGAPDGTPGNPWNDDYPDPATLTPPPADLRSLVAEDEPDPDQP